MPNNAYPPEMVAKIREMRSQGVTVRLICEALKVGEKTVQRHTRDIKVVGNTGPRRGEQASIEVSSAIPAACPFPAPEAGGPKCPEPVKLEWAPFVVDNPGHVGVLCDSHIPCHDMPTVMAWFNECKQRNVKTILLNGDIMDCVGCSQHDRQPSDTRFEEDLIAAEQFLQWVRASFPQARIIYKEGNHENRLPRYLMQYAPDLARLKQMQLPSLLNVSKYGVEWVDKKRTIELGKLLVYHGHEFKGGGGVNTARWLYLKVNESSMCGHFHKTDQHSNQTGRRVHQASWSVGAACFLYPEWLPNNKWNNGYAMVEVANDGQFSVANRQWINGKIC